MLSMRNITGYALAAEPPPQPAFAVRKVAGYALVPTLPQINLRKLNVYGMYSKQNLNFKDKTSFEILFDVINTEAITPFTQAQVSLGDPQVRDVTSGIRRNTSIELTALPGNPYAGKMTMKYNRFGLARPFVTPTTLGFTVAADTTVHALIASINTAHNLKLVARDLVNNVVKAGAVSITLVAASTSYIYLPTSRVTIGQQLPTIASAVTVTALSGFDPITA